MNYFYTILFCFLISTGFSQSIDSSYQRPAPYYLKAKAKTKVSGNITYVKLKIKGYTEPVSISAQEFEDVSPYRASDFVSDRLKNLDSTAVAEQIYRYGFLEFVYALDTNRKLISFFSEEHGDSNWGSSIFPDGYYYFHSRSKRKMTLITVNKHLPENAKLFINAGIQRTEEGKMVIVIIETDYLRVGKVRD